MQHFCEQVELEEYSIYSVYSTSESGITGKPGIAGHRFRPHSFGDFSGRGTAGISFPTSTYSSSNGTEIILFRNKSPKFNQIYHHYSSYSCSSSYSTLWGGIDGIDGILFQFYLFPKKFAFHLLFLYSTSSYSQKIVKSFAVIHLV